MVMMSFPGWLHSPEHRWCSQSIRKLSTTCMLSFQKHYIQVLSHIYWGYWIGVVIGLCASFICFECPLKTCGLQRMLSCSVLYFWLVRFCLTCQILSLFLVLFGVIANIDVIILMTRNPILLLSVSCFLLTLLCNWNFIDFCLVSSVVLPFSGHWEPALCSFYSTF